MRVGYSMWGFLGAGVVDTPDGARSYRRAVVDGLRGAGHGVVFLQRNRDRDEASDPVLDFRWDDGLPPLDALVLEWRWRLPGRNDTPCGSIGHTCDLHRQTQLVEHYTRTAGTPTLLWDLDRQLQPDDPLPGLPNVFVADFALRPGPGVVSLPCPVPDVLLDTADPAALVALDRPTDLVYVGNRYDRDPSFDTYFAPAARQLVHEVAGKWTGVERWPHVRFIGRVAYPDVVSIHLRSLATVLLMPDRYASVGATGSRLFEAVTAGCVPLATAELASADVFVPPQLVVTDGAQVVERVRWLRRIQGTAEHVAILAQCLQRLEPFRASRHAAALDQLLRQISNAARAAGTARTDLEVTTRS
ncbi:hypothetical protein KZZ52_33415 [Dactylosporangium sp. AC04546]|uniref:hypothetical protein n=1 Tax=Dactylosporangium sp. AC04546 TaxID=2862460 RepID=UPI001EDEC904|nr:hypothetical protein [Dactylosporangium sp. AC04546]WVK78878.1 hypothetical protein KZZ52_33415 [Dactylosporangium sp. AC04546]